MKKEEPSDWCNFSILITSLEMDVQKHCLPLSLYKYPRLAGYSLLKDDFILHKLFVCLFMIIQNLFWGTLLICLHFSLLVSRGRGEATLGIRTDRLAAPGRQIHVDTNTAVLITGIHSLLSNCMHFAKFFSPVSDNFSLDLLLVGSSHLKFLLSVSVPHGPNVEEKASELCAMMLCTNIEHNVKFNVLPLKGLFLILVTTWGGGNFI